MDEKVKPGKAKQAASDTLTTIADDCINVLAFLQDVAVKSTRVITAPLSLRAYKHARIWFQRLADVNISVMPKPSPQDHLGIMGVLNDVATRLHTAEAIRPVVATQREA